MSGDGCAEMDGASVPHATSKTAAAESRIEVHLNASPERERTSVFSIARLVITDPSLDWEIPLAGHAASFSVQARANKHS